MTNIWDTDTVSNMVGQAAEAVSRAVADRAKRDFASFVAQMGPRSKCESPIEAAFWVWWQVLEHHRDDWPPLALQYQVSLPGGSYRLDFALPHVKVAIEMDGHDFHERTRDQVAYRNKRDRDLQADGWMVLHFSGAEFLRDPVTCILEVESKFRTRVPADVSVVTVAAPAPEMHVLSDGHEAILTAWMDEIRRERRFFYGTVVSMAANITAGDGFIRMEWRECHRALYRQAEMHKQYLESVASRAAGQAVVIDLDLSS